MPTYSGINTEKLLEAMIANQSLLSLAYKASSEIIAERMKYHINCMKKSSQLSGLHMAAVELRMAEEAYIKARSQKHAAKKKLRKLEDAELLTKGLHPSKAGPKHRHQLYVSGSIALAAASIQEKHAQLTGMLP